MRSRRLLAGLLAAQVELFGIFARTLDGAAALDRLEEDAELQGELVLPVRIQVDVEGVAQRIAIQDDLTFEEALEGRQIGNAW